MKKCIKPRQTFEICCMRSNSLVFPCRNLIKTFLMTANRPFSDNYFQYGRTKNGPTPSMYYRDCEDILFALRKCVPHMISMDGQLNMWIIKPGSSSRGRGILLGNRLENILKVVDSGNRRRRYVLQKYIERPMLIFETKFDIRQWFLVTSWNPLVIWMYKECYLR